MSFELKKMIAAAGKQSLDLVFPRRCPMCDRPVRPGTRICPECVDKPEPVGRDYCLICGRRVASPELAYCPDCERTGVRNFSMGASVYLYRSVAGSLYRLKYKGRREYADYFGQVMADRARQVLLPRAKFFPDLVVPVPMHRARERERGYNQAALLAETMASGLGIPMNGRVLERTSRTGPLRMMSAEERARTLRGAFCASAIAIAGKTIIIVDDIYTTGATTDACARALREAGAADVLVMTLASGYIPSR